MKTRLMMSVLIIALVATVIGGGTMAWFTAKAELENEFQAGTVMVSASEFGSFEGKVENVNPGDCYCLQFNVHNAGSKAVALRVTSVGMWEFDWEYLEANWEKLCFSTDYETVGQFRDAWEGQEPGMGDPLNPVYINNCPLSPWIFYAVSPTEYYFYFKGYGDDFGKVEAGENVMLCLCVAFDGPLMGNIFQSATFSLAGVVQAVQWSNDAPSLLWGAEGWNAVQEPGYVPHHPYFEDFDWSKCVLPDGINAPCCWPVSYPDP